MSADQSAASVRGTIDDGDPRGDDASERSDRFRTLFLELTGRRQLTEAQEDVGHSKFVDARSAAVADYVAMAADNHGLEETYDESPVDD